jgi:putative hydrolase
MVEGLKRALAEARAGEKPLDRGGLAAAVATPEQRTVLDQIGGMMSLLEGHGDVTMNRAGAGLIPSAERFERVLRARRQSAPVITRFLQRLIGLEAKMAQYAQGERFIGAVEDAGGPELLDRAWQGSAWLPTLEEIREPQRWIERTQRVEIVSA